jgi:signal transduction histidine kinase
MPKDNKVHIYNRLFFKLYLNYAVMLLVTAVLICLIFMKLYGDMTMNSNIDEMKGQANTIGDMASAYITSGKEGFLEDIEKIRKVNSWDIWTISNPYANNPMSSSMETGDSYEVFVAVEEYAPYVECINKAFRGITNHQKWADDVYEKTIITVAAPIKGAGQEVVGAIMIIRKADDQSELVKKSLSMVVMSSVVALGISFIIVIIFATELSMPISRMRITALELASGNFKAKTGIKRDDELGDLAKTVDILSEKLLENDIERKKLDQMRLDFFANVSHELRTPITVIRAYTETLSDGVVQEEEKVHQYYDRMLSECKSMERLVGDLLLLSKMQNPDFAIEREPVNLNQIFEDIIRSAGAIAEKKGIRIKVTKDSPVNMILGDYDRLRQMFMVILDNAIKFSEENKSVHIKIEKADKIIVSIKDEGVGIDPSDINNIFEKFYKSNLRQNASGTGLGLAIAKQIALKHEGSIQVNSTPGIGSEFIFSFPRFDESCEMN